MNSSRKVYHSAHEKERLDQGHVAGSYSKRPQRMAKSFFRAQVDLFSS